MKILALVAARGGSKRLPGKNVRVLGGKSLIEWTIGTAMGLSDICEILVSTDDPAIAATAADAGASVPWLRPAALATDTATSVDVALHALDWYEARNGPVDGLLLLQPTSPFRTRGTVLRGIDLFKTNGRQPVVGVSPVREHPMWTFRIEDGALVPFVAGGSTDARSQDLPPMFVLNGSFYLIAPADLRAARAFVTKHATPLVIESAREALDIDTEWDWQIAECALDGKPEAGPCASAG